MTLAGTQAVKSAFERASGSEWPTVRQEYVATRIDGLYNPFEVDDLDAGGVALDLVRRAYLQGLRDALRLDGDTRAARAARTQREAEYTRRLMEMFNREANPEWVTDRERAYIESSIQQAFRTGCDEGRLPLGSVI